MNPKKASRTKNHREQNKSSQVTDDRSQVRRLVAFLALLVVLCSFYGYRHLWRPQQLLERSRQLAGTDLVEAERLAEQAILLSSGDFPAAQLHRSQLLGRMGHWEEALGGFSLIEDPGSLEVDELVAAGDAAYRAGALHLARRCYQAALKSDGTVPSSYRRLIRLELAAGNEERARNYGQKLIELVPDDAVAWQVIGTVSMNQREPQNAIDAFEKALQMELEPGTRIAILEDLVQVLIDNGDIEKARSRLKILSENGALSDRATLQHAYLLRLDGKPAEALKQIESVLSTNSSRKLAAKQLAGTLNLDLGRPEEAIRHLQAVVQAQPFNKEAHFKIAEAYRAVGDEDQAQVHLLKSEELTNQAVELLELIEQLGQRPSDSLLRKRVATLYRKLGKPEQAERISKGAIE